MLRRGFPPEHAKAFLDVVLGVVIALPMAELPGIIIKVINAYEQTLLSSILLLISAISFSAFYWLETRRFIEDQGEFEKVLKEALAPPPEELKKNLSNVRVESEFLSLERFAGSIVMIALVASILKFAEGLNGEAGKSHFRAFILASLTFWVIDLLGNIEVYRKYSPFRELINHPELNLSGDIGLKLSDARSWYNARFRSYNFFYYSAGNSIFFLVLLLLDYGFAEGHPRDNYRVVAATIILGFTILRHLVWRVNIDRD